MLMFLENALERYDYENNEVPLVMVGHSNIFFNKREFKKFLKTVSEKYLPSGKVKFSTFQEFVENNLK